MSSTEWILTLARKQLRLASRWPRTLAAASLVSAQVVALTEGVIKSMLPTKIKIATVVVSMTAALAGAAGLIYQTPAAEEPIAKDKKLSANKDQTKDKDKQVKGQDEKLQVLIDKVLAAHGGEEKLSKLKFIEEAETPNPPDPISVTYFVESSERFREHVTHTGVKYAVLPTVRFREEVKHTEFHPWDHVHSIERVFAGCPD